MASKLLKKSHLISFRIAIVLSLVLASVSTTIIFYVENDLNLSVSNQDQQENFFKKLRNEKIVKKENNNFNKYIYWFIGLSLFYSLLSFKVYKLLIEKFFKTDNQKKVLKGAEIIDEQTLSNNINQDIFKLKIQNDNRTQVHKLLDIIDLIIHIIFNAKKIKRENELFHEFRKI